MICSSMFTSTERTDQMGRTWVTKLRTPHSKNVFSTKRILTSVQILNLEQGLFVGYETSNFDAFTIIKGPIISSNTSKWACGDSLRSAHLHVQLTVFA